MNANLRDDLPLGPVGTAVLGIMLALMYVAHHAGCGLGTLVPLLLAGGTVAFLADTWYDAARDSRSRRDPDPRRAGHGHSARE